MMESFRRKAMKFRNLLTAITGRQTSLLLDDDYLDGLDVLARSKVAAALAQVLLQAAGVTVGELDDDKR